MDSANLPNASSVYKKMSDLWAYQMGLALQAKRKRVSIRAKWEKVGKGWQPKGHTKKTFRANYVASGNLIKNISVEGDGLDWSVNMPLYAQAIILGRKPMGKGKGGKGIKPSTMKEWTKVRKIKARDPQTGQFVQQTKKNKNSMRFMFNRKIKHFGIEPYDFTKHTKEYVLQEYRSKLRGALKQDIENLIKKPLK